MLEKKVDNNTDERWLQLLRVEPRLHNTYKPSIKQDENKKSATQIDVEEQQSSNGQLNQSKGLQYMEARQTTAQLTGPLKPTPNQKVSIVKPNEDSNTPKIANQSVVSGHAPSISSVKKTQETPTIRSSKVNIAQIIKDFNNTANAIATPEDTFEEVKGYLSLVETQAKKPQPNENLVKSNLRNAALLLDGYISETLNKKSKVVENWVEAVFLQQVNYKYDELEINEDLMVRMPEGNSESKKSKDIEPQVEVQKPSIDEDLKTLFTQAKKTDSSAQAIDIYQQALNRSVEVQDKDVQGKIHFEMAKVYDNDDEIDKALENYSKAVSCSEDLNVKSKAHYSMAQIYDEQKDYTKAIDNYVEAISYAGEADNLNAQTASLTKIGNIYADNYDNTAFKIYDEAKGLAESTENSKLKGYVSANTAKACEKFNKIYSAYSLYTDAADNYQKADLQEKAAINFKNAGKVIKSIQPETAKTSFKKALKIAVEIKDKNLIKNINHSFLYS